MRILVVDDEEPARRRLVRLLSQLDDVKLAGEATDGTEALDLIAELNPDLVLLDIRMPGLDGFAVASRPHLPPIVFTTAYAEHAVKAFELAAIDYLVKPIELERLRSAIDRVRRRELRLTPSVLADLIGEMREPRLPLARIAARTGTSVRLLAPGDVTRFHAADKYTVVLHAGEELVLDDSLASLEERLRAHHFLRVHRSELVNLKHVRSLHGEDDGIWVELSDGQRAAVSRRMLKELKTRLGIQLTQGAG